MLDTPDREPEIITHTGCQDFSTVGSVLLRVMYGGDFQCTRHSGVVNDEGDMEAVARCPRYLEITPDGAAAMGECMMTAQVHTLPRRFTTPGPGDICLDLPPAA